MTATKKKPTVLQKIVPEKVGYFLLLTGRNVTPRTFHLHVGAKGEGRGRLERAARYLLRTEVPLAFSEGFRKGEIIYGHENGKVEKTGVLFLDLERMEEGQA